MKERIFSLSNLELLRILESEHDYQPLAVEYAKKEFHARLLSKDEINVLKEKLEQEKKNENQSDYKLILNKTLKRLNEFSLINFRKVKTTSLALLVLYSFYIINDWDFIKLMVEDINNADFSSILFFLQLILFPTSVILLLRGAKLGWLGTNFILVWIALNNIYSLLSILKNSFGSSDLIRLNDTNSTVTQIIQLLIILSPIIVMKEKAVLNGYNIKKAEQVITYFLPLLLMLLLITHR